MSSARLLAVPALFLFAGLAEAATAPRYREGEVIVKFRQGTSAARMHAVARAAGSQATLVRPTGDPLTGTVGNPRIALTRFPRSISVARRPASTCAR